MFHRDQTKRFDAGNTLNLHGIAALTASLPIFLRPLRARRSSPMSPPYREIQPQRLGQN